LQDKQFIRKKCEEWREGIMRRFGHKRIRNYKLEASNVLRNIRSLQRLKDRIERGDAKAVAVCVWAMSFCSLTLWQLEDFVGA
jgi:hypothetical protein